VATPQTRHFPFKEPDARNLFFFHIQRIILWDCHDVGCDRMATPLGKLGLSFVFCLIIAILIVVFICLFFLHLLL
jgi:hypothetical protein